MALVATIIMGVLTARLFLIQVIHGPRYSKMALPQQTLSIPIEEIKGNITDRNGIPLTGIDTEYELIVIPKSMEHETEAYDAVYRLTQREKESLPVTSHYILQVVNKDPMLLYDIESGKYRGLIIKKNNIRYGKSSLARHLVGYIRKSDNKPLSGIEKAYGDFLHPGEYKVLHALAYNKDAVLPNYRYVISEPESDYQDVRLTLDFHIQDALENILDIYTDHKHGGIVVEVGSGEILALASRPHFDQNNPTKGDDSQISELSIPLNPYPPGSIFKLVVAAAALESGKYNEYSMFHCKGGIQVGSHFVRCHESTEGLGHITFKEAFAYSCNDTFIKIASDLGGDVIVDMAEQLGFGTPLDIDLQNASGQFGSKDTYIGSGISNLAIGQGDVLVTPLQVADALLTIINDGEKKRLSLVKGLVSPNGEFESNDKPIISSKRILSSNTARILKRCMVDTVEYGTGTIARDLEIGGTAGKTGTPEVSSDANDSTMYGWFAGYFPVEEPRYIVVIMSKEEGVASKTAAPVFHDIARAIWQLEKEFGEKK